MAELKTRPNRASVTDFVNAVECPDARRDCRDCRTLIKLLREVTGKRPVMWGRSIGYGSYAYTTAAKHSGKWPITGLSPHKQDLTIYVMNGFSSYADLMEQLGPHKTGTSCLYIRRLSDGHGKEPTRPNSPLGPNQQIDTGQQGQFDRVLVLHHATYERFRGKST